MKKQFSIKGENEQKIEWELGRVQRPSRLEVQKVLKVLDSSSAILMKEALESGASNEEASRLVPFVLSENKIARKAIKKYALWVLACFWYFFGGGPKPATPKVRRIKKDSKQYVQKWVNDNLVCPLCNMVWTPSESFNSREEALPKFAQWLLEHSKECQKGVKNGLQG